PGHVLHDDILKFRDLAQPPVHEDADLERLRTRLRRHAGRAGRDLYVLRVERADDVRGHEVVRCHLLWVHPYPHAEVIRKPRDIAYAVDAQQRILDEYVGVIIQEGDIMGRPGRIYGDHHQLAGVDRPNGDPEAGRHCGQQRVGDADAVLHVQRGDVDIRSDIERHIHGHEPVVRAVALHVLHAGTSVDL